MLSLLLSELSHITHALCESTLIIIRVDSHKMRCYVIIIIWVDSHKMRCYYHYYYLMLIHIRCVVIIIIIIWVDSHKMRCYHCYYLSLIHIRCVIIIIIICILMSHKTALLLSLLLSELIHITHAYVNHYSDIIWVDSHTDALLSLCDYQSLIHIRCVIIIWVDSHKHALCDYLSLIHIRCVVIIIIIWCWVT